MNTNKSNNIVNNSHNLSLENRKKLTLSGILDLSNFNDKCITAHTNIDIIIIKGEFLNIKKLNLELGELEIEGKILSLEYKKSSHAKKIFSKLFK